MSLTTIANRYARALVDVTTERGQTFDVLADLDRFAALLKSYRALRCVCEPGNTAGPQA